MIGDLAACRAAWQGECLARARGRSTTTVMPAATMTAATIPTTIPVLDESSLASATVGVVVAAVVSGDSGVVVVSAGALDTGVVTAGTLVVSAAGDVLCGVAGGTTAGGIVPGAPVTRSMTGLGLSGSSAPAGQSLIHASSVPSL